MNTVTAGDLSDNHRGGTVAIDFLSRFRVQVDFRPKTVTLTDR
jgi:hypothetical protein